MSITNQNTEDYGFSYFGEDYGREIYGYVKDNYDYLKRIKTSSTQEDFLWIDIYSLY